MKTLFTLLISLFGYYTYGQIYDNCNFEQGCQHQFIIDKNSFPNNSWQIGKPQKTVFDSAYSLVNAIVTDTLNPYTINDTSMFIVKHVKSPWSQVIDFALSFYYKLDFDSGEIAKIEVSGDSGQHWIDVMAEDTTYDFSWGGNKPRLDTSAHEWKYFSLHMTTWRNSDSSNSQYPSYISSDTFLYRFTFISDSVQTNKDGWMMDNFLFEDWVEGVTDLKNDRLINVYPNPSNGNITIKHKAVGIQTSTISVYNLQGQEVYQTGNIPRNGQLQLSLPDGVYYLRYANGEQYAVKKITIIN